ncbi:MAG: DUF779 domain-containing protein [Actinomycetes bacterium]
MQVTATDAAVEVVRRAVLSRAGVLTITLGTGCCESTAPFLYEDFWPGPDQAPVGAVGEVVVYAPEYLRGMYPGDDGVVIDVFEGLAESMSIETEFGCRLILRGLGVDSGSAEDQCKVASDDSQVGALSLVDLDVGQRVKGELPESLRRMRMR